MPDYEKWKEAVLLNEANIRGIPVSAKHSRNEAIDALRLWDIESDKSTIGDVVIILNFLAIVFILMLMTEQPAGQLSANFAKMIVVAGIVVLLVNAMLGLIKISLSRHSRRIRKHYQPKEK